MPPYLQSSNLREARALILNRFLTITFLEDILGVNIKHAEIQIQETAFWQWEEKHYSHNSEA